MSAPPPLLFANNAVTTLAVGISNSVTSLTVAMNSGGLFPNPTAPSTFRCTLNSAPGATIQLPEIVSVTARSADVFTITRAQEGTTAQAWAAGALVQQLFTAGDQAAMVQTNSQASLQTLNLDGSVLDVGHSLTVTPIGNAIATLAKVSLQAASSSTATRGFMVDLGLNSVTSGGTGPTGGNVVLYTGMEADAGTGDAWSQNPLLTIGSGAGVNVHNFQVLEVDMNNNDSADANGDTLVNGISITGAGLKSCWVGLGIFGNTQSGAPNWQYGVISGVGNSCAIAALAAVGNSAYGLDLAGFTGAVPIVLPGGLVLLVGSGLPSGSFPIGSLYLRTDAPGTYQSNGGGSWSLVGTMKNTSLTGSTTIAQGNISLSYNASGGAITQALPSISSMAAYDQQLIEIWKTDSSGNAITVTSSDGFLGLGNSQSVTAQGGSLTLKIDVPTTSYKVK